MHNDCGINAIIEAMPSSLKQLNMCKDFAASLVERMTVQGIKGEMVTLKSSRNIWSDAFNMNNYPDNLGTVVFYKNGIESNRMFYNQFKLLQNKANPISGGL